ncbi:hypothetical protein KUCAC02_007287 [Chaenocephalus aceratus]|uniref:Uncharacterized protein n=1 Tax=Chaenocephalus aceratus TaxID=36190 RepID=A0ACB9X511_CHAAC|nr:hypothetical protein KUCAC02_007287 [Chaenocephalus aceratus]
MKPAVGSSAAPREETDLRPLPPGWRSYTSPEGLRYYVNSCSKANGCHSSLRTSLTEAADVALRRPTMSKRTLSVLERSPAKTVGSTGAADRGDLDWDSVGQS